MNYIYVGCAAEVTASEASGIKCEVISQLSGGVWTVKIFPKGEVTNAVVESLEFLGGPEVVRALCIHHFGLEHWPQRKTE